MKFAALIYSDESNPENTPDPSSPEFGEMIAEYKAFGAKHADAIVGGEALEPAITATSLQVRDGESIVSDGPFAETKEQLGGFYLLECENLDVALRIAADIPHAKNGAIEVRSVPDFG